MNEVEETVRLASVNGVALHAEGEVLAQEVLRQRACVELLRQAAMKAGLLAVNDVPGQEGVISEAASDAIEALLEREVAVPEPDDAACRRHHAANAARFDEGEALRLRHILFAVTPGVDVVALRQHAEKVLLEVRCHDGQGEDPFSAAARSQSNCPSGAEGGELGWLTADQCAPEFARELFGKNEVGVLPRLVHSRFGLHVVEVVERRPGTSRSFEDVAGAVRASLRQQAYHTALRQVIALLAGQAAIEGVDLEAADSPLVQ